jgi:ankyrin repeat protein
MDLWNGKKMTELSDDKNPANQFGWNPLHSAAKPGQIRICQVILENTGQHTDAEI